MLVQGIAGDVNALGFFGLAYYVENANKLKAVAIKPKDDAKAVMPSVEAARDGSYQPLSRPIFIYVSKKSIESKPEVGKFVEFYLDKKQRVEAGQGSWLRAASGQGLRRVHAALQGSRPRYCLPRLQSWHFGGRTAEDAADQLIARYA